MGDDAYCSACGGTDHSDYDCPMIFGEAPSTHKEEEKGEEFSILKTCSYCFDETVDADANECPTCGHEFGEDA